VSTGSRDPASERWSGPARPPPERLDYHRGPLDVGQCLQRHRNRIELAKAAGLDVLDGQVVVLILGPQALAFGMQHQRWAQAFVADPQNGTAKDGAEPSGHVTGNGDHLI